MEGEKEEGILDDWRHRHPLCLVEAATATATATATASRDFASSDHIMCYGCIRSSRWIGGGEQMYACSKRCGSKIAFHKECAEIPRKIKHPLHPHHILIIKYYFDFDFYSADRRCAFCKSVISDQWVNYSCTSPECYEFHLHLKCAQAWGPMNADDDVEEQEQEQRRRSRRIIIHDLHHPKHELLLVSRRAGGSHSFRCDACGSKERGDSYLCTVCDNFWIHQKCTSLPPSITMPCHGHSLSLAPLFPLQSYSISQFDHGNTSSSRCGICYVEFNPRYWVYHCQFCTYFAVHIKCAFKQVVVTYPITDVVNRRITPFVEAIRGRTSAAAFFSRSDDVDVIVPFHKHTLSLIPQPIPRPPSPIPLSSSSSSSSSSHSNSDSDPDSDSDSDSNSDEEYICDGCITPILDKGDCLRCSECNYFLHRACSQLPPHLPSLPLHDKGSNHELVLQSCSKLEFEAKCKVCNLYTNGLMYACKACDFKADINCAVLPDSIHHTGHDRRHLLNHFSNEEMQNVRHDSCDAGPGCAPLHNQYYYSDCYVCGSCDFTLHAACALLPETITDREWDKNHPLLLTYGSAATGTDIYCDCCEKLVSPKQWVYRCYSCDLTFHTRCFPAVSGEYRNIKFGQQYTIADAHPHPLAYQLLTTKRRCDICRRDAYGLRGFQCEPCYFFICLDECAQPFLQDARIQILDES